MDIEQPDFQVISGHSIDSVRPVFSHDSKKLLVPSGNTARVYSTSNGRLESVLGNESSTSHVIDLQQHPNNKDQIIIFTSSGHLEVWNIKTKQIVLSTEFYQQDEAKKSVFAAYLRSYSNDKDQANRTIVYYTLDIKANSSQYLYMKEVNLISVEEPAAKKMKSESMEAQWIKIFDKHYTGKLKVSFSPNGTFVSFCHNRVMCGYRLSPIKAGPLHFSEPSFTCIMSHPSEDIVATGNDLGKIVVWTNFLDRTQPIKSEYHWHPNPLTDLFFSPCSSVLYSGGKEAVIVSWDLEAGNKKCLPRIGAPIKFMTTDSNHKYISVTKIDNSIDIYTTDLHNFNKKIVPICEMIKSVDFKQSEVAYHPQLDSLVTRGSPGHLQFFSLSAPAVNLDIVGRNLFPEDDPSKMSNPQIWSFCISPDGDWLVTDDGRDDGINLMEERFKFWQFDTSKNMFVVNTVINHPHDKKINFTIFSPDSKTVISTSDDGSFKLWNHKQETKSWSSNRCSTNNNEWIPTNACFSSDSSIVAVLFKNTIHCYGISNNALVCTNFIFHPDTILNDPVSGMCFGNDTYSQFFVEVRGHLIRIWKMLESKVVWEYKNPALLMNLTIDPITNQMTCFSTDNNLIMFSFDQNKPKKVCTAKLGSGKEWNIRPLVIPKGGSRTKNHLVLVTSRQEFVSLGNLEEKQVENVEPYPMEEGLVHLFGQVVNNESTVVPLIQHRKVKPQFNVDKLVEELFLKNPSHTLPPVEQLCNTFLSCLVSNTNIKVEVEDEVD